MIRWGSAASVALLLVAVPAGAAQATSMTPEVTRAMSVCASGSMPDSYVGGASASEDGSRVVFNSRATDLPGANGAEQIYLNNNGTVELVSTSLSGASGGNENSLNAVISADGKWVAYRSGAGDLVTGFGTFGVAQLYLYDVEARTTRALSWDPFSPGNGLADGIEAGLAISQDGSRVAFRSPQRLTATPVGTRVQAYVVDTASGQFGLVSSTIDRRAADHDVTALSMSPDGSEFGFVTASRKMTAATSIHPRAQAYVREIPTLSSPDVTRLASRSSAGSEAEADVRDVAVADDGAVAFTSSATNLVATSSTLVGMHVFYTDSTGTVELVTHEVDDVTSPVLDASVALSPSISADGVRVAYVSNGTTMTALPGAGLQQAYVWDAPSSMTTAVSVTPGGDLGNGHSLEVNLTRDGMGVALLSMARDLVTGYMPKDVVRTQQVYVRGLSAPMAGPVTG